MLKKVLVTGGTGFVGEALVRALVGDAVEVIALVREGSDTARLQTLGARLRVVRHDGTTEQLADLLIAERPDLVFHVASLFLADHQPADVEALVGANVLFSTQLVEAMCAAGCMHMVNVGTVWQHYHVHEYRPVNLYAATKQAFRDILAYYHDARGVSCLTLKLPDTYGPGDRRKKLLALLFGLLKSGESLEMSPGEQRLSLVHVDDVVNGLRHAGQLLLSGERPVLDDYVLPGDTLTLRDLVSLLERLAQRPLRVNWGGRPYRSREVMFPTLDCNPRLPGWQQTISLEDGLRRLLAASGLS